MPGFLRTPPPNARVDAAAGSATQLQANSSLGLDRITHIMAEQRGNSVEAHAPIDGLGRQGVTKLVGGDVPNAGIVAQAA